MMQIILEPFSMIHCYKFMIQEFMIQYTGIVIFVFS